MSSKKIKGADVFLKRSDLRDKIIPGASRNACNSETATSTSIYKVVLVPDVISSDVSGRVSEEENLQQSPVQLIEYRGIGA